MVRVNKGTPRLFKEGEGSYQCSGNCGKSVNKIYPINGKQYCTKCYQSKYGGLKKND